VSAGTGGASVRKPPKPAGLRMESLQAGKPRQHFPEPVWAAWGTALLEPQRNHRVHFRCPPRRNVPKGRWWPLLRLLSTFEYEGWRALTPRFRKVLETTITKDVLSGRFDPKHKNAPEKTAFIHIVPSPDGRHIMPPSCPPFAQCGHSSL
jgi:hypothetical protein